MPASVLGQRDTKTQHTETWRATTGQKRGDVAENGRLGDLVNGSRLRGTVVSREGLGEAERIEKQDGGKKEKEESGNEKMWKTPFPDPFKFFTFF